MPVSVLQKIPAKIIDNAAAFGLLVYLLLLGWLMYLAGVDSNANPASVAGLLPLEMMVIGVPLFVVLCVYLFLDRRRRSQKSASPMIRVFGLLVAAAYLIVAAYFATALPQFIR